MDPKELTIHHVQIHQPWVVPYSQGVILASCDAVPHILGSHTVLHASKSVGKLAAVFEKLDHTGGYPSELEVKEIASMSADLVTAAIRIANLYEFDLASALAKRIADKNGVDILQVK